MTEKLPTKPSKHQIGRVLLRTLSKAWDDSIFSESAQAAFWQALSLPPLLLGLLGSLSFIAPAFGPNTLATIEDRLISTSNRFFSPSVVNEIIAPTITDIVQNARGEVVSMGFIVSLWAGSSAVSAFVDSIVEAHDQTPLRHPVRQRFYALGLYVVTLVVAVVMLPLIALGPRKIADWLPDSWDNVLQYGYWPMLGISLILIVTVLYRVALPKPLPAHRLVFGAVLATLVFLCASVGLRFYLGWITKTGYTYGALATPIAFLLFAFFMGFAVCIGAELNNAIQEQWPASQPQTHRFRRRLQSRIQGEDIADVDDTPADAPADAPAAPVSPS
jgi:membrane protein